MRIIIFLLSMSLAFASLSIAKTISWDQNPDADYYIVYTKPLGSNDSEYTPASEQIRGLSYEFKGLNDGETFDVSVKAFNVCGNGSNFSDSIILTGYNAGSITFTGAGPIVTWSYDSPELLSGYKINLISASDNVEYFINDGFAKSFNLCSVDGVLTNVEYNVTITPIAVDGTLGSPMEVPIIIKMPEKTQGLRIE